MEGKHHRLTLKLKTNLPSCIKKGKESAAAPAGSQKLQLSINWISPAAFNFSIESCDIIIIIIIRSIDRSLALRQTLPTMRYYYCYTIDRLLRCTWRNGGRKFRFRRAKPVDRNFRIDLSSLSMIRVETINRTSDWRCGADRHRITNAILAVTHRRSTVLGAPWRF
jgi:hypothetical protein